MSFPIFRYLPLLWVSFVLLGGCTNSIPVNNPEKTDISVRNGDNSSDEATVEVIRAGVAEPERSYLPGDTLHLILSSALAEAPSRSLSFSTDSGETVQPFPADNIIASSTPEFKVVVPYNWKNRRYCRLIVETQNDTVPGRFFSVKSLILIKPFGGMAFHPGDTMEIRWRTRTTFSVAGYLRALTATESKLLMPEASVTPQMNEWPAVWPSFYYIVEEEDLCEECVLSIEDYLDPVTSDYVRGFSITPPGGASVRSGGY